MGELVAGFIRPAASPVVAVGNAVITLTPEPVKDVAIRTFGQDDKFALVVGTLVLVALYALVVGVVGLRSRRLGVLGVALFGVVGVVAALTRPAGGPLDALPSVVGAVVRGPRAAGAARRRSPAVLRDAAGRTTRPCWSGCAALASADRAGGDWTAAGSSSLGGVASGPPSGRRAAAGCCSGASTSPRHAPG